MDNVPFKRVITFPTGIGNLIHLIILYCSLIIVYYSRNAKEDILKWFTVHAGDVVGNDAHVICPQQHCSTV